MVYSVKSWRHAWILPAGLLVLQATAGALERTEPWAFTAPVPRTQQQAPSDSTAPVSLDQEARDAYAAAMQALASNEVSQAAVHIQQALVSAPDNTTILALAGRIFTRQGSFGLAANCWRQMLAAFPGSATLRAELGAALLYMGKEAEARGHVEAAMAASPGDLTARYYQGLLLVRDREFERAADNFAPLTGFQILQTIRRLQEDRELITTLSSSEGYRHMARAVMNAKTGADTEAVLDKVRQNLEALQPLMVAQDWTNAAPRLRAIYQAGARFPALEYDIGLCQYGINPGPKPLDALEKLIVSPRGLGFRRLFTYLCFQAGDAARAQRAVGDYLATQADEEALLLRAAILQGLQQEDAAWALLEGIPPSLRAATLPWFNRTFTDIQQLRQNPRFETWLNAGKSE